MQRFIARQPILDRFERVYGYKLLYRPEVVEAWPDLSDIPTGRASTEALPFAGFNELIDGTRAFIKCPQHLFEKPPAEFPREQTVIEISASTAPDQATIDHCRDLKDAGYSIALENFPALDENPLAEFADVIKMDVSASADRAQWLLIRKYRPKGTIFIADKVETRAQFQAAVQQGYSYFQGNFFLRPQPAANSDLSPTKLVYLLVLSAVTRPEIDMDEMARTIKHDLAMSYKLLRFLNSARFAFHSKVKSIRHALLLLGENELRKWIALISVAAMGDGGPPVLVAMALIRAAFCESFAVIMGEPKRQADYFFMGLLSSIDVLLRRPMRVILEELPIAEDVSAALMGEKGSMRDILDAVLNFERGKWDECAQLAAKFGLKEEKIFGLQMQALHWSRELTDTAEEELAETKRV